MSQEIERKFLVTDLPDVSTLNAATLSQGYITAPDDSAEVRLRRKGAQYFITIKSKGDLSRAEYEVEVSDTHFSTLWPATEGRRVEKTRYTGTLPCDTKFELDVFSGSLASLVLVEVEFDSLEAAHSFSPPSWFGADVTKDARFKNSSLALAAPVAP